MRLTPYRVPFLMCALTMPLNQGACVRNPVTGGRQLALISESQEIAIGKESHLRINGNAAYLGQYRLQQETGTVDVLAGFIAYGNNIYQLAGMAPTSAFSSFVRGFDGASRGFRELTDARILSVQPDRVRIYRARQGETLRGIMKGQTLSRVKLEDLALLNRLDLDQTLAAGTPVKLVRPGRSISKG